MIMLRYAYITYPAVGAMPFELKYTVSTEVYFYHLVQQIIVLVQNHKQWLRQLKL